jgi:hypothetical protein
MGVQIDWDGGKKLKAAVLREISLRPFALQVPLRPLPPPPACASARLKLRVRTLESRRSVCRADLRAAFRPPPCAAHPRAPAPGLLRSHLRHFLRLPRGRGPPPLRTNRTRRVPHPVLIGHAASLTPAPPRPDPTRPDPGAADARGAAAGKVLVATSTNQLLTVDVDSMGRESAAASRDGEAPRGAAAGAEGVHGRRCGSVDVLLSPHCGEARRNRAGELLGNMAVSAPPPPSPSY